MSDLQRQGQVSAVRRQGKGGWHRDERVPDVPRLEGMPYLQRQRSLIAYLVHGDPDAEQRINTLLGHLSDVPEPPRLSIEGTAA